MWGFPLCPHGMSGGLSADLLISKSGRQETAREGVGMADPSVPCRRQDPLGDAGAELSAPQAASRGQHRLHHKGRAPGLLGGEACSCRASPTGGKVAGKPLHPGRSWSQQKEDRPQTPCRPAAQLSPRTCPSTETALSSPLISKS